MHQKTALYFICISFFILLSSCKKNKPAPTAASGPSCDSKYNKDVKPFVLSKCAISGCHVANFPFGDFTGFSDLKSRISNGKVTALVFKQKLMPPANAVKLTDQELGKLKCWIDNGAAED